MKSLSVLSQNQKQADSSPLTRTDFPGPSITALHLLSNRTKTGRLSVAYIVPLYWKF